ncbi:hypothetical protein T4D_11607 [Trichinella pseudospiralis]|uniref:Uncharacterized protein n=1 Tax=Trichinella pseudospiralis TaxID=6337 RepID=A0A0V1FCV0_TRIPS|nr:hypothetical protein T4D_11607 [Trichinella pseudospiralis]
MDCDDDCTIVIEVFKKFKLSWNKVEHTQSNGKDENEDVDVSDKPDKDVSHLEAYFCSEVGLKWMKQQKEFSATQLMRHIRNVAAQKKLSSFKQKLITDYMEYNAKIPGAFRTYR